MFKSNRYLQIFIVLAILILSISAVSAENTTNDGISSINDANDLNNQNLREYNPTKTWDPQQFLDNIDDISNGDIILITNGNANVNKNITLNKDNVIVYAEGNVIFNGGAANAQFRITGSDVLIQGITFTNFNYTGYGGAVYWSGFNATITNCTFTNNVASNDGGAIYLYNVHSSHIYDCLFVNNTALYAGAIGWTMSDNFIVSNCTFINNSAKVNGGAFQSLAFDNGTVTDCIFINNTANSNGGGVYWASPDGILANSVFINNTALFYGGGVYWGSDRGTVTNCTFKNNKAISNNAHYGGGAIIWFSANNGTVTDCTFINNTAFYGGAIYWFGSEKGTISNCSFKDNKANEIGGAICWYTLASYKSDNGLVEDCNFVNSSGKFGEGIYNNAENFSLGLGNGTLVYNEGLISQVNATMLDNKTYSVIEGQKVNLTAKVTSNNYTIIDPNFNFVVDGHEIASTLVKDQFTAQYTVPAADKVVVSGVYSKGQSVKYKNGLLLIKEFVNITGNNVTADYGQQITLNVDVESGNAAVNEGTVYVNINNKNYTGNVVNGHGTIIILAGLNAGEYKAIVFYKENDNYFAANTTLTIKVNKIASNVQLNVSNTTYGQPTIANVTLGDINDTVNITINNKNYAVTLVNGKGSTVINGLDAGKYTANVVFKGNNNYIGSSTQYNFVVEKADSNIKLDVNSVNYGNRIVANITLTTSNNAPITGTVKITINNKNYTVNVVNGKGNIVIRNLDEGNYTITATFEGDNNYNESSDSSNVELIGSEYYLESWDVVKYFENGTQYHVKVTDKQGNPAAGVDVTVSIDGKYFKNLTYTIVSNASGIATLPIRLIPGNYNITAILDNQAVNNTITVLPVTYNLIAENINMLHKDGTSYTVKVVDGEGNPVVGQNVAIVIDSSKWTKKAYYNIITDNNGIASLPINLAVGQYSVTAKCADESVTTKINVLSEPYVLEVSDVIKYFKNGTQYTVTVKDLGGNVVANKTVAVTLNSPNWKSPVTYNIVTNDYGIATLTINLAPGQYTAKATVGDNIATSAILVIPTLTSESLIKPVNQPGNLVAKLVDGHGNPLSGKSITFTVKTKIYTKITDLNGLATLPIHLGVGVWIINIADQETNAKITTKVTVTKATA